MMNDAEKFLVWLIKKKFRRIEVVLDDEQSI